jgi:carbon starvation protein
VAESPVLAPFFTFKGETLALIIIGYGFVASVLPVWLLLAPRDYLSTFLKIGTILALACGIVVVMPDMKMPAVTQFADGTGPVFSGSLFPFLFITIACGAVSGFHALISSGTTPKMIETETQVAFIGYGGMLMESFVAVMAMIAASVIEPGIYFAMNSPAAVIGTDLTQAAAKISSWGFVVTPEMLSETARDVGETSILSRTGGAPTLAVGMAHIFSSVIGGKAMMGFWYHFAILFEALFILTAVAAGTRACRFMVQDMIGAVAPSFRATRSWGNNLIATAIAVSMWGYILYAGVTDPFGGINSLWPLFGISNQMLAGMALITIAVILYKMKRERHVWVPLLPAAWLLICTTYAGMLKVFSPDPKIGFWAQADRFRIAIGEDKILGPAKTMGQMHQVMVNNYLDAVLAFAFVLVVVAILVYGLIAVRKAQRSAAPTAVEVDGPAPVEVRHA